MKLSKVAVIGDADSVLGFRGLGFQVITTNQASVALTKIKELELAGCALIFISEYLISQSPDILNIYKEKTLPALISIPSIQGGENYVLNDLRESVKKAIGMDLLNIGNEN